MRRWHWPLGVAIALFAQSAAAHSGPQFAGGFVAGFVHPFGGLDHLLAMVSVGIWGAFLGRPLVYQLPVIFPTVMVGGAALGMVGLAPMPIELGIALSVIVLGGCIAIALKPHAWIVWAIVAAFAVFHGYGHGRELPSAANPFGYSAGFVFATGLLHLAGIAIGSFGHRPGGTLAARGAGAVICCLGGWFVFGALR